MAEHFAPKVIIGNTTVIPEGWMWVVGLALAGDEWAINTCNDPEYDLRGKMRDYESRRRAYFFEQEIDELEKRLARLKSQMPSI